MEIRTLGYFPAIARKENMTRQRKMLMYGKEAQQTKLIQTAALRYSEQGKHDRIALSRANRQNVFCSTYTVI